MYVCHTVFICSVSKFAYTSDSADVLGALLCSLENNHILYIYIYFLILFLFLFWKPYILLFPGTFTDKNFESMNTCTSIMLLEVGALLYLLLRMWNALFKCDIRGQVKKLVDTGKGNLLYAKYNTVEYYTK